MANRSFSISRGAGRRFAKTVEEYGRTLRRTCEALAAQAAAGRELAPAAVWLLDNFMFVHAQWREARDALPAAFYRHLPPCEKTASNQAPRVCRIAEDILAELGGELHADRIRVCLEDRQRQAPLTLAELWALGPMLKLAIVHALCEEAGSGTLQSAQAETAVRRAITGLRALESLRWREVVESASLTEHILRQDPACVYPGMDFETRDLYRKCVERLARGSGLREERVAQIALELANEGARGVQDTPRRGHVGYYLAGPGLGRLEARAGYRCRCAEVLGRAVRRRPNGFYLGGIVLLTGMLAAAASRLLGSLPRWYAILLVIPASQASVVMVNRLIHFLIPPTRLPRLDFSEGIPASSRAFVVVPTLLLSRAEVEKLLERLEIHYLANRSPNLFFALLTDFPDSRTPQGDPRLPEACADGIRILNQRYGRAGHAPFYLFHRAPKWNPGESAWMGHERKRGKLNDFNALLRGRQDAFHTKVGDLSVLPTVRYVITLDSDTQLPRDAARDMLAAMTHPLNRPVLDPGTNTVREGYGILQPRVAISMESASRSRLAWIYGGQPGFDPYATAVSDVYQDLHSQASFTGKGVYDVAVFDRVMQGRFPDNTLLSHDLIEGEHARVGLVADLELVDDYPSTYESYCKRKHRWVRGDWQIALWLLPWAPDAGWRWVRNPLGVLSRWKIFDNLRRSLVEPALLALFLGGWLALPDGCARTTAALTALPLLPAYLEFLLSLLRLPPARLWKSYLRELLFRLGQGHLEALFNLAFLPCQGLLMADAVIRTLTRMCVTRRRLLEWETMAQSETPAQSGASLVRTSLALCPVLALAAITALALAGASADGATSLLLALWALAPLTVIWVNGRPEQDAGPAKGDLDFLRLVCLRTWRYFTGSPSAESHWLTPDYVREEPALAAHRTSPTNMGLQLTANLAAHDLGYLTQQELAERLRQVLESMSRLERYRGHFLNWYDTRTLKPLAPLYVSTVDSGNLAASLLALKQGCLEVLASPLIGPASLLGLRDHCLLFQGVLPTEAHTGSIIRLTASLLRQLAYSPTDLFFWEGVLAEARSLVERLREPVEWVCSQLQARCPAETAVIRLQYDALSARARSVLDHVRALAPWLAPRFETELRVCSRGTGLGELMELLCRVPRLRELPAQYQAIASAIHRRLRDPRPLPASTRRVLLDLLPALDGAKREAADLVAEFTRQAELVSGWVEEMNFAFLFDATRKLLRIGWDVESGRADQAHYDLLASEARSAVFLAIAKGDIPREAWFRLQRKLVAYRGQRTMFSWSGTMFEYLLPCLYMRTYPHTLLAESLLGAVRVQQVYGRQRGVPWGISEAACGARDHALSHQYRAFGVPELAADPHRAEDLVIAPYASMLAAMVDRPAAAQNLRQMAACGWLGTYGFYESVDFSRGPVLVRMYMTHHQAMGLVALSNVLLGARMQARFHADSLVVSAEFLLQERLPGLLEIRPEEKLLREPATSPARAGSPIPAVFPG